VKVLVAAAVSVPFDKFSNVDDLRLDVWRGRGRRRSNGSSSSDNSLLSGGRSRWGGLGLVAGLLAWCCWGGRGGRRGLGARGFTAAKVKLQVGIGRAELGLAVIPFNVRNSGGLGGVVYAEDGAVLVVDSRGIHTTLVARLEVETISATRAVLQVSYAVDEGHIEIIASIVFAGVDLVLQLSNVFFAASVELGKLD